MSGLSFDTDGIGTPDRRIAWGDVCAVDIRTTSQGPFVEDLFWIFVLRDRVLTIVGGGVDTQALRILQAHLPGFDDGAVIRAMSSTDDSVFRVWHPHAEQVRWDHGAKRVRFGLLVQRLGGSPDAATVTFERLVRAWSEPGRRYHDLRHLADCLHQIDHSVSAPEADRNIAELAVWFHDAVYQPTARDNEASSARMLLEECRELGIPDSVSQQAAKIVQSTNYGASARSTDPASALVRDIDLSILAADRVRFMEYEHAIEEEFAAVPTFKFRIARGRFLASLLARPAIFETALFRERDEARAREQVAALLRSPRYRVFRLLRWLRWF